MVELTKFIFQLNGLDYSITILSKNNISGNTLDFEVILREVVSNRIVFYSVCGDWTSVKYTVDSYFNKIATMFKLDPNLVESVRDGFLKN